jgi:hypothetical protein
MSDRHRECTWPLIMVGPARHGWRRRSGVGQRARISARDECVFRVEVLVDAFNASFAA